MEMLTRAYLCVQEKRVEEAAAVAEALKSLPRTERGIFDLSAWNGVEERLFPSPSVACDSGMPGEQEEIRIARLAYPVYAAYETVCNKKEGYPDIQVQLRERSRMLQEDFTFEHAAFFADLLIHTICWISQEVYEYYRELVDLFRDCVKNTLKVFCEDGILQGNQEAADLFREALRTACGNEVLLAEKYQDYL